MRDPDPLRGPRHFTPLPAWQILDDAARDFGPRPALNFMGKRLTYAALAAEANRAAAGLQALGVHKGTRVGLCLPNTPYSVIMYYAVLKAGGTVVNFNPLYTQAEIDKLAAMARVEMMVTLDAAALFGKIQALAASGRLRQVVVCSLAAALPWPKRLGLLLLKRKSLAVAPKTANFIHYAALLTGDAMPHPVMVEPLRDVAVVQFTGGTTGLPKPALLSHANISVNVQQAIAVMPPLERGTERILALLPFFHVFAMTAVMNFGLTIGAELLLLPRMEMQPLMQLLYKRRPTVVPGVPTLFTAISEAAEAKGRTDLSFIKFCISGGAPLSLEVKERFERLAQARILEGYGLSETSPIVSFSQITREKPGGVGPAVPGTVVEIRDPADPARILPQGERGEVCVRGPQVMLGYENAPEDTARAFVEGALRTGDIGYLDADGCLFIVDRIKDLILCGGFNVYPRVIEEAAYEHPAVLEAVAVGVPDAYRGQAPKLYVTLREGAAASAEEILVFLRAHLNPIECPKAVEIRETLPKTMVGKLSKKELIAENLPGPAA